MIKVNKLNIPLYDSVLSGHQVVSLVNIKVPETFQTLERKALVINADFASNKWMDRGNTIEPLIQDYIANNTEQFGITGHVEDTTHWLGNFNYITKPHNYTVAADVAFIKADANGGMDMAHDDNVIIEIKSGNTDKSWAGYSKKAKKDHVIQLAWYMRCTGIKKGKLVYADLRESKYEFKTDTVEVINKHGIKVPKTVHSFPDFKEFTDLKDMEFVTYDVTWEDVEEHFTPEVEARVDAYMKCVEASKNKGTIVEYEDLMKAFNYKGFWQEQKDADVNLRGTLEQYKSFKGALRQIGIDIKLLKEEEAPEDEIAVKTNRQTEIKNKISAITDTIKDTLEASGLDCIIYPEIMLRIPRGRERSYIVDRLDEGVTVLTDTDRALKMRARARRAAQ